MITVTGNKQHQTRCGQVPLSLLLHFRGHHGLQGQITPLNIFLHLHELFVQVVKLKTFDILNTHFEKKSF